MPKFQFVLLYVESPSVSAAFYAKLLGVPPVEQSPTFAMLPLREGVMLGLWQKAGVTPAVTAAPGGSEIALVVDDRAAVTDTHAAWAASGVAIAQPPCAMDFGYTFTALDPDGHRIRVLTPEQP